jgi:hypothetical protein
MLFVGKFQTVNKNKTHTERERERGGGEGERENELREITRHTALVSPTGTL